MAYVAFYVVGFYTAFIIIWSAGAYTEKDIIHHGCASYVCDSTTGDCTFTWNTEPGDTTNGED